MATGTIQNSGAIQELTVTISGGSTPILEFATWGSVTAYKVGRMVFVRFHGFMPRADIISSSAVVTISGGTASIDASAPVHIGKNACNGIASIGKGSNTINMNAVARQVSSANAWSYCEFIYAV